MHESTIDNVKLEQQLNSNSKADGLPSSPNDGNTLVVCRAVFAIRLILMSLIIYFGLTDLDNGKYFIGTVELIIGILLCVAYYHIYKVR